MPALPATTVVTKPPTRIYLPSTGPRVGGTPKDQPIDLAPTETPMPRLQCPDCPATAATPGGLGVHRARKHAKNGARAMKAPATSKALATTTTPRQPAPAPDDDLSIVVALGSVSHALDTIETTVVHSRDAAHDLAAMLARLGHRTFILNLDGPSITEYDRDGEIG